MQFNILLDGEQVSVWVESHVSQHELVVQVLITWAIHFIVVGQAICYLVCNTIHVLDGEVKTGYVFPPVSLPARQAQLSLKVLETLMVCDYDEFSS